MSEFFSSVVQFMVPWEFSIFLVVFFVGAAWLYRLGSRRQFVSTARRIAFWLGFFLFYISLHTRVDYYAEHEFFAHRIQHLILHHLAPLLIMASYPGSVMRAGLPRRWRGRLRAWEHSHSARGFFRIMLQPWWVSLLFIASVLVWLIPSVQFVSMIDERIYRFMNFSVALTGLMYWWMLLDHRLAPPARLAPGLRVLSPLITMTPQILVGAIITFTEHDLYPIFDLCGRAFGLPARLDQSIGGLIMWIPAALIEAIGSSIALKHWIRLSNTRTLRRTLTQSTPTAGVLSS